MKELKKKAVIGTTAGLASLIITAAGCAYGPPPDRGDYVGTYPEEAVIEHSATAQDSETEDTVNTDSADSEISREMRQGSVVYGPPNGH